MKKYILGSAILSTVLFTGCSLDENPKSSFGEQDAFKTSTLIYSNSVASVYNSINGYIYGNSTESIHTLEQFASDECVVPGRQRDWIDGGKWQNFFLHNFLSSVNMYDLVWNHTYTTISQANKAIDKLNSLVDNAKAKEYVYELRALRAIEFYYLLDMWGQVPLVTSSNVSASEVSQSNRSEVFKFVTSELEECLPHLSAEKSQNQGEFYGRVTKAVAYMCLTKCAMNAPVYTIDNTAVDSYKDFVGTDLSGKNTVSETVGEKITVRGNNIKMVVDGTTRNAWETAKYCVEQIEKLGYALQPSYADNFIPTNDNSVENIFTRPNDDVTYRITDYNQVRTFHYNHAKAAGWNGWNGSCATLFTMRQYGYGTDQVDPRLKLNFYIGTDYTEDTGGVLVDAGSSDGRSLEYEPLAVVLNFGDKADKFDVKCAGARMKKYKLDRSATLIGAGNNDLVIWRYGDALLLKAEAMYRMGDKSTALTELNKVRARVGAKALTSISLNDIATERILELCWEGVRRMDAIRFGTFTQPTEDRYKGVFHASVAGDYVDDTQGYTTVFPIPYNQLNLNKNLKQNPGYNNQ